MMWMNYFYHKRDPVGYVGPRLSSGKETSRSLKISAGSDHTIFCPAQAFPVPSFRLVLDAQFFPVLRRNFHSACTHFLVTVICYYSHGIQCIWAAHNLSFQSFGVGKALQCDRAYH